MRRRFAIVVPALLLFAVISPLAQAADAVVARVTADETRRIVIEFRLNDYRLEPVTIDGRDFVVPVIPGEAVALEEGAPAVPHAARSVIVAGGAAWSARVLAETHRDLPLAVAPSKGNLSRHVDPASVPYRFGEAYAADGFYPGPLAETAAPYVLRDFTGVSVTFLPFQYQPSTATLRVVETMTVELTPAGPLPAEAPARATRPIVRAFDAVYAAHFLNYAAQRAASYPPLDEQGEILVIAHDPWVTNLGAFAEHKASLGFTVEIVPVSTIGNTSAAIKNYIRSVYEARDLAFVLLVGDAEQVATTIRKVGSENGACDACYGKVAGTDDYPDVLVGRFSASSAADVDTQVARTETYETLPATLEPWFERGVGIASDQGAGQGDEGQSDRQHEDEIRGWLLADGYTLVDRIYDPGASDLQLANALNDGRGIVNYTGHGSASSWGTTGFNVSDVNALVNDDRLPFIFSVACNNGEFHHFGTCFAEAWLRARHDGAPTGAIATYMSSVSQYWAPPMEAQDEFNLLLTDTSRPYFAFGALAFAASASMIDAYGNDGIDMSDTWLVFGDPSVQVVGVPQPVHGLKVSPTDGLSAAGQVGGPFSPTEQAYTLENLDDAPIDYDVSTAEEWVVVESGRGALAPGARSSVTVRLGPEAANLDIGTHLASVSFINLTDHSGDTTRAVSLTIGGSINSRRFPLDADPGWSREGEWQFGPPAGAGGTIAGNPDPSSAATGTNVFGVNLQGDFQNKVGGPYYLTAGPFDLSAVTGAELRFKRWLNIAGAPYVAATVEASNDGSHWTKAWSATTQVTDAAWIPVALDVSSTADGEAVAWFRWGYQVLRPLAITTSGWNVDDIEIWGQPASARITLQVGKTVLDWTPLDGVSMYDVVKGGVASLLASAGDFSIATESCLADDLPETTLAFGERPVAGDALWLLVRGAGNGSALTWGDLAPGQVAPRDPGIAASGRSCP